MINTTCFTENVGDFSQAHQEKISNGEYPVILAGTDGVYIHKFVNEAELSELCFWEGTDEDRTAQEALYGTIPMVYDGFSTGEIKSKDVPKEDNESVD